MMGGLVIEIEEYKFMISIICVVVTPPAWNSSVVFPTNCFVRYLCAMVLSFLFNLHMERKTFSTLRVNR